MTIEEALDILENGNWFSYVDNNAPQSTVSKVAEAINTLARNIRITHGHINREKWEPCELCSGKHLQTVGFDDRIYLCSGNSKPPENERFRFCPSCGRPLTDQAWDELEKRMRG